MYVIICLYLVNMASSGSVGSSHNIYLGVFSGAIWYYRVQDYNRWSVSASVKVWGMGQNRPLVNMGLW